MSKIPFTIKFEQYTNKTQSDKITSNIKKKKGKNPHLMCRSGTRRWLSRLLLAGCCGLCSWPCYERWEPVLVIGPAVLVSARRSCLNGECWPGKTLLSHKTGHVLGGEREERGGGLGVSVTWLWGQLDGYFLCMVALKRPVNFHSDNQ